MIFSKNLKIVLALVFCVVAGVAAHAQPTQQQVDDLCQTIRDLEDQAKAIKDASDDPAVQTNARAIERIANVAKTLGVELDGQIDAGPVDPPPVVDPPDPPPLDTGWLARTPHDEAEHLLPGADLQAALDTGRDVLLPAGSGDWPAVTMSNDGQLLGVYGVGDRPEVERITVKAGADDVTIKGLRLADDLRDPDSPGFDKDRPEQTGIYVAGQQSGLLVEDCVIEYHAKGIVLQGSGGGLGPSNCAIHRNIIRYNWNKGDRGAGIYTNRARNLRVEENLIDHNGWHPAINSRDDDAIHQRGLQAHGCYFSGRYNSGVPDKWDAADNGQEFVVEFHGNIVSRSSANGCQFRLGAVCTDNVFTQNPMAFYTWTNASQVHRNAIMDGTHVDYSDEFYQRGWGIQIITSGDYTDNLIANVSRPAAGSWAVVYEHGGAEVHDNVFYNWRPPGKDGSVWDKNDTGLPRVTNNTDTIGGDIDATLTDAQIEQIADRERGVWGDAYDGAVISENLRKAYQ